MKELIWIAVTVGVGFVVWNYWEIILVSILILSVLVFLVTIYTADEELKEKRLKELNKLKKKYL